MVSCPFWVFRFMPVLICCSLCNQLSTWSVNCLEEHSNTPDEVCTVVPPPDRMVKVCLCRAGTTFVLRWPGGRQRVPVPAGWARTWSRLGLHSWGVKHFQKESGVSSKGAGWLWSLMNLKCLNWTRYFWPNRKEIHNCLDKENSLISWKGRPWEVTLPSPSSFPSPPPLLASSLHLPHPPPSWKPICNHYSGCHVGWWNAFSPFALAAAGRSRPGHGGERRASLPLPEAHESRQAAW